VANLLPCPFCGGPASTEHFEGALKGWRWSVGCSDHRIEADEGGSVERVCYGFQSMTSFATKAEAIAAWNRRAPVSGWQSIETAPRDGTRFLTWDSYYGVRMGRAFMRADHDDWLSYVDSNGSSHKGGIRASHWMPLPAAPVDGARMRDDDMIEAMARKICDEPNQ